MSGWTKVFLATGLMVVALACFNLALWRRMKEARRLGALRTDEAEDSGSQD
ncbi:hypothetical protein SPDO_05510 [Sphingomonas dokdonensis]|uniref:Heme exporter protein D n=1 Tax=Sphingomonas dokdonensis TaxID=344880 RepID=A0A245ZVA5_9SPHN|nr:hypothetical protein SPDO_05510 [Sphingomonas dokdonensis]